MTNDHILKSKQSWRDIEAHAIRKMRRQARMTPLVEPNAAYSAKVLSWCAVGCLMILLIAGCSGEALAATPVIDMDKIAQIESSGCVQKYGHYEHARGCYQITKPVISEWNQFHKNDQHTLDQMLNDELCLKVASWYVNKRIPQMLKHYGIKDTVKNRLIAYNAGINTLVKNKPLPEITKRYLAKYGRAS